MCFHAMKFLFKASKEFIMGLFCRRYKKMLYLMKIRFLSFLCCVLPGLCGVHSLASFSAQSNKAIVLLYIIRLTACVKIQTVSYLFTFSAPKVWTEPEKDLIL